MAKLRKLRLRPEDREFFSLVLEVITRNPFSEDRSEVGWLISPACRRTQTLRERQFNEALNERLAALAKKDDGKITNYSDSDRQLVAYARLFHSYIHIVDELDRLIRQEADTGKTAHVAFAESVLKQLHECGFTQKESLRYFSLFYQVRRAFHFIVESLIGESPCMRRLKEALWNNVFTADLITYDNHLWSRMEDFSSLLIGETGTGKGAAAAAIGRSGFIPFDPETGRFATSFQRSFIAANLSQFPESLIESELFGHCEGAFTGAVKDHKGVFERCSQYGSLLLDEIGELSVPVQVKLLQVLQERIFTPVGSDRHMRFSGRVIAATNQSLVSIRNSGAFRDDFFYRLSSDVIVVPPLRQRIAESRGELELLISVVMTRILGVNEPDITRNVAEILGINLTHDYCWPGNVRELEQTVRRILITGGYAPKGVASFSRRDFVLAEVLSNTSLSMSELASQYCSSLYALYGNYEAVARHTGLDARTVKKHLLHT